MCKLGFGDSGEDSHAENVGSGWSGWREAASGMGAVVKAAANARRAGPQTATGFTATAVLKRLSG
ncbi:MAG: hypothetical protein CPSOU_5413 [uncultured Paraburkholderia sp.]|nr:MAG: hypothetical protein CPSOU_5413 [uncultured Paraburkholderia sp.]